jgi:putative transposase
VKTACELLGKSRATLYRKKNPEPPAEKKKADKPRAPHPAALSEDERREVLEALDSDRFADKSRAGAKVGVYASGGVSRSGLVFRGRVA